MTQQRSIEVTEEIEASADALWQAVSDFEHIDRWADLKIRAIAGSGIGCMRTVEMENGAVVTERLLVRDQERMVFSYEIVAPNPYPMHDYRSTVVIERISARNSRLLWSGSYVPAPDIDPAKTDKLLRKVYGNGIELLRRHLSRQE